MKPHVHIPLSRMVLHKGELDLFKKEVGLSLSILIPLAFFGGKQCLPLPILQIRLQVRP